MIRKIVYYPNKILKEKSVPVSDSEINSEEIQLLIDDMIDTIEFTKAYGLAAPQIGFNKRIFVMRIDADIVVFVNPVATPTFGDREPTISFTNIFTKDSLEKHGSGEGCLSLPGIIVDLPRFESIILNYKDRTATQHSVELRKLNSICAQHEIDHLDGILMVDKLSKLKRDMILKKVSNTLKKRKN